MKYKEAQSTILELRGKIPKTDQIIKTIIGFCNPHGGKIIIGVSSNREIIGIREETATACIEFLGKAIYENPPPYSTPYLHSKDR